VKDGHGYPKATPGGVMAVMEKVQKTTTKRPQEKTPNGMPSKNVDTEKLKADLDSIIDDIDEVIEGEAEEFVRSYVQKGGQVTCLLGGECDVPLLVHEQKLSRLW
jgi:ubiquitin-like protein Pup